MIISGVCIFRLCFCAYACTHTHIHAHTRTYARTHARTHVTLTYVRTHARTHAVLLRYGKVYCRSTALFCNRRSACIRHAHLHTQRRTRHSSHIGTPIYLPIPLFLFQFASLPHSIFLFLSVSLPPSLPLPPSLSLSFCLSGSLVAALSFSRGIVCTLWPCTAGRSLHVECCPWAKNLLLSFSLLGMFFSLSFFFLCVRFVWFTLLLRLSLYLSRRCVASGSFWAFTRTDPPTTTMMGPGSLSLSTSDSTC